MLTHDAVTADMVKGYVSKILTYAPDYPGGGGRAANIGDNITEQ